ncbi:TonB-dependent receptor [Acetobacter okinawensis]|uniref:TonB-dependent receptor n=2 Tax=Acetobacter okinawensis TaxID=1076594 RepID=UPI000472C9B0|nr:TonB-dependent receptor [Acetobacter okinawensis]
MTFTPITQRVTFALVLTTSTVYAASAAQLPSTTQQQTSATPPKPTPSLTPRPAAPQAAGKLEEITVRSNKRAQKANTTPASIVALSGQTLQTTGVRDALTLARDVPGLMAETTSGSANPRYRLRGIGTNDFSANMTTAVGVSEDDVFLDSGASQGVPIYDLDHVEVFRGPQGTLQGKNTTAGMVSYYTKKPTNKLDGYVRGTAGNYGLWGEEGALGGPIIKDKLMARFAIVNRDYDGQYYNGTHKNPTGGYQYYDMRGQILAKPIDHLSILVKLHTGRNKTMVPIDHVGLLDGGTDAQGYAQTSTRNIQNNGRTDATTRRSGLSVNAKYDFENGWSLANIFALEWNHFNVFSDDDASPAPVDYQENIGGVARVLSNEVRVVSPLNKKIRYVGGVYYMRNLTQSYSQQPLYSPTNFGVDGNASSFNINTQDAAVFSALSFDLTSRLTLDIGGRFTSETRSANGEAWAYNTDPSNPYNTNSRALTYINTNTNTYIDPATGQAMSGPPLSKTFNKDSEDASLKYRIAPGVIAYLRYARGFRTGNYNTYVATTSDFSLYNPEELTDYEGGIKARVWGGKAQLNLSGFHYNYDNMQVTILQNTGTHTTNAAQAVSNGFEFEGQVRPLQNLFGSFGVTYQDAHYTNFKNASAPTPFNGGNPVDLSGQPLERAPHVTANFLLSYKIPVSFGDFTVQTDWRYTSRYRFQAWSDAHAATPAAFLASPQMQALVRQAFSQNPVITGNVRIAWHSVDEKTEVAFWLHNVTNQMTYTNAFGEFFNRNISRYPGDLRAFGFEVMRSL